MKPLVRGWLTPAYSVPFAGKPDKCGWLFSAPTHDSGQPAAIVLQPFQGIALSEGPGRKGTALPGLFDSGDLQRPAAPSSPQVRRVGRGSVLAQSVTTGLRRLRRHCLGARHRLCRGYGSGFSHAPLNLISAGRVAPGRRNVYLVSRFVRARRKI